MVANFTENDLDALTKFRRVIWDRRKLKAIVDNSRGMFALVERRGTFRSYLCSNEKTATNLRKQLGFLGDMYAYHFLWVINEEVMRLTWAYGSHILPLESPGVS